MAGHTDGSIHQSSTSSSPFARRPPPEHSVAAGLLALEIAAQHLQHIRQHDVDKALRAGKQPHMEAEVRAERAAYLYHQGRNALLAVRALMGMPSKLRRDAAIARNRIGGASVADAIDHIATEIESFFGETKP